MTQASNASVRQLPVMICLCCIASVTFAAPLMAGVAKVDITNYDAGPVNDPLFAKALVLKNDATIVAMVTVDAVALGEIGYIRNDYLATVRSRVEADLAIPPTHIMINASHCHGIVCDDVAARTVEAIRQAAQQLVPVNIGAGVGHEDRISENRRFKLRNGREADSRHAYSMPWDNDVVDVGPIDPEIGILRLDKSDGNTLAVVFNFACHPIQGVPGGSNTADLTGFASQVIEDNLDGAIALFLQGCAGDINPVRYKAVDAPRDAEPLGNRLGLSALKGIRAIRTTGDARLTLVNETIELPRSDTAAQIAAMEAEQERLLQSLQGTTLNFKTFVPLYIKYGLSGEFPAYYSHAYLHEEKLGRADLRKFDEETRKNLQQYIDNIHTMEQLTRLQTNLALLRKHQATNTAASKPTVSVEIAGIRIGDFVLVTFPGELTVQIGLNIKQASPHVHTYVAGYTNGYIYYAPTAEQLCNVGGAQEDSECIVAPEWQALYEAKIREILERL